MRFYLVNELGDDDRAEWAATLPEARAIVRAVPSTFRGAMRVHLVDVKTDKASLLELLARHNPAVSAPLRTWRGTARGGLKPDE